MPRWTLVGSLGTPVGVCSGETYPEALWRWREQRGQLSPDLDILYIVDRVEGRRIFLADPVYA